MSPRESPKERLGARLRGVFGNTRRRPFMFQMMTDHLAPATSREVVLLWRKFAELAVEEVTASAA